jgi:AcrR family transcriptional regulator
MPSRSSSRRPQAAGPPAAEPRPPRGLRERNKRAKLARIVTAARDLFARKGFAATATSEVARRARIGTGTLFLYAKDKYELLFLVFRDEMAQLEADAFATLPDAGLTEQLAHVFGRCFAHFGRTPDLARVYLKELLFRSGGERQEVGALTIDSIRHLAALVEHAQARGEVRADVAPLIAASSLFALYYFTVHTWLGGFFGAAEAQQLLRESLELFVGGLGPLRPPARTGPR